MRKNLLLLGLLLAGVMVYIFLIKKPDNNSLDPMDIEFAIADTSAIYTIHLTEYEKGEVSRSIGLQRQPDSSWWVNERYVAFQPRINTLLKVMHLIHVKEIIPPKGLETARKILPAKRTHVEAFDQNGKTMKAYDLSIEYKDGKGSLMQLEGSDTPVIVELPGLQGFVNAYYSLSENHWRENLLFDLQIDNLRAVQIEYADARSDLYLQRAGVAGSWQVVGPEKDLDAIKIADYLALYEGKIYAESFAEGVYPGMKEQLQGRNPDISWKLSYIDGSERILQLYARSDNPNNFFGLITGADELLTVQHFVVDKYLRSASDFQGSMIP